MNKKMMIVAVALVASLGAFARPHGGGGPRGGAPMVYGGGFGRYGGHHHHDSVWGRGGRNFWPGFVGGIVGGALFDAVATPRPVIYNTPAPVVVTQPVVVAPTPVVTYPSTPVVRYRQVWVEGCYVDQVQPNGTVIRVWQPGHYEQQPY